MGAGRRGDGIWETRSWELGDGVGEKNSLGRWEKGGWEMGDTGVGDRRRYPPVHPL